MRSQSSLLLWITIAIPCCSVIQAQDATRCVFCPEEFNLDPDIKLNGIWQELPAENKPLFGPVVETCQNYAQFTELVSDNDVCNADWVNDIRRNCYEWVPEGGMSGDYTLLPEKVINNSDARLYTGWSCD